MYFGFFISNVIKATESKVKRIEVDGNGEMYFIFNINGVWVIPSGGAYAQFASQEPDFDAVVNKGVTLDELKQTDLSFLDGQRFLIGVAVGDPKTPPRFKMSVIMTQAGVQTTESIESEEYNVHGEIQSIEKVSTDNVTLLVSGYKDGRWLPYTSLETAKNDYEKVKFKATLSVEELGQKAELKSVTLTAKPNNVVIPSDTVDIYTKKPVKDAKIYVVGNNKGIVRAFCSSTTPAQWRELERLTQTSFDGANGMLKLVLETDGEEKPEVDGYIIQE